MKDIYWKLNLPYPTLKAPFYHLELALLGAGPERWKKGALADENQDPCSGMNSALEGFYKQQNIWFILGAKRGVNFFIGLAVFSDVCPSVV